MGLILRSQDSQPNYIDEMYIEEKKNARDNFKFMFFYEQFYLYMS